MVENANPVPQDYGSQTGPWAVWEALGQGFIQGGASGLKK